MTINLDGIPVQFVRKKIRNINLRVTAQGQVQLSAPINCSDHTVRVFLDSKKAWIKKHVLRLQKQSPLHKPFSSPHNSLDFFGISYQIHYLSTTEKPKIRLGEGCVYIYIKDNATFSEREALIQGWYREQMKRLLPELIKKWEAIIKVSAKEYRIKIMKTRWGSCNTREKRIWLNLSLIQKPLACLEYVLVHELVHLHEASHNQRFYTLMQKFMPEWRAYKKMLENFEYQKHI